MLAVVMGGQTPWYLLKIKYEKEEFFKCPPIAILIIVGWLNRWGLKTLAVQNS